MAMTRKNRKTRSRKTRKSVRVQSTRQKKTVKQLIRSIVRGQEEKKYQQLSSSGTNFNGAISGTNEWYNPIPVINQGTGAFQRDGNVIKPTLLDMTWHISLGTGISRSCDDVVVLYLFKCKNLRSYADMVARGSAGVFLDKGSQGLSSFQGNLTDLACPVNNDAFTVITKRVFKLTKGTGFLNNDGTSTYNGAGGKTSHVVNVKLRKLPNFMYQQGNQDGLPENYGLCWALGYAKSDGSAPDVIFQDVRVDFVSNLYFTDA